MLFVWFALAICATAQCEKLSAPKLKFSSEEMAQRVVHRTDIAVPSGARIQGTVVARLYLRPDGTVECVQVVHGHPLLAEPVKRSLPNWRFRESAERTVGDLHISWKNGWSLK